MHHRVMGPPAVSYAVHRSTLLGLVLLALWLPGVVLAVVAFVSSGARFTVLHLTLLAAILALSTFGLGAFWRAQRQRILRWDGRQWTLDDPQAKPSPINLRGVEVRLDLQAVLLLRCLGRDQRVRTWIWVERSTQFERWHLLRCALHHALPAESDGSPIEGGLGAV